MAKKVMSLSETKKELERLQKELDEGMAEKANVIGKEIMNEYGGSLLDFNDTDLKNLVNHLNVATAIAEIQTEKDEQSRSKKRTVKRSDKTPDHEISEEQKNDNLENNNPDFGFQNQNIKPPEEQNAGIHYEG